MFIGVYMIMVFDPQIQFNDGFYDLIHVKMPKGSVLQPEFPPLWDAEPTLWPASSMSLVVHWAITPRDGDGGWLRLEPPFFILWRRQRWVSVPVDGNSVRWYSPDAAGGGNDGHSWGPLF
ncbi:MAG: hypothetical protein Ct9H300mP14_02910 [Gammaproteobacteria bacterium]|nr:MAG: hypothetical protein Ct9H300mP14_02910 [Gammaproteobacteria bacterium]